MANLGQTLNNPAYAALICAFVTLIVMYIDHRISKTPDYLTDYLKNMIYVGGLVFGVVYMITNPKSVQRVGTIMNEPF